MTFFYVYVFQSVILHAKSVYLFWRESHECWWLFVYHKLGVWWKLYWRLFLYHTQAINMLYGSAWSENIIEQYSLLLCLRFLEDSSIVWSDKSSSWMVPVTISTASSPTKVVHQLILDKTEETVEVKGVKDGDWLKVSRWEMIRGSDLVLRELYKALP